MSAKVLFFLLVFGFNLLFSEELKLSHFLPSSHTISKDFIVPWVNELEACTKGKVNVTIYPAGSDYGAVTKQISQVRSGEIDIAHGLTGLTRGGLPRTMIIDMPMLTNSSLTASKALWELYKEKEISAEYRGLKVLALHAHNPGHIHTSNKKVVNPEDLKGLRIRYPSKSTEILLDHLGAKVVALPPTQVYSSLQRGIIDGALFPWEAVGGFKLNEQLHYHLKSSLYTTSFFFVMNKRKFKSLSKTTQQCIDKISGGDLVNRLGSLWNKWDQKGFSKIDKKNAHITKLTPKQKKHWEEKLEPVKKKYLEFLKKQGIENPEKLYEKAMKIVSKIEKEK